MPGLQANNPTLSLRALLGAIASISIPAVVTNITTPLLALCDVAIMGHIADAGADVFIAAIAAGGTMFNMLYWLCGFLRMGSSGITAQASGAGDTPYAVATLYRALLVALALAAMMILFRAPLAALFFAIIDADSTVRDMAMRYFLIVIWGAPAMLGMYALTGWLLGLRNTSIAMWVSVIVNLFNIALSVFLVYVVRLDIVGVALGTLSAQWLGFIVCAICALRRYRPHRLPWRYIADAAGLKRFFSVNTDIFLRTLCLVTVTLYFTRVGAMQGAMMLAVNALLMQFFTVFSYFMDGLAFAGEALCGHSRGAGDTLRLHFTVRVLLVIGALISLLFALLYGLGGHSILHLLSSDSSVVSAAMTHIRWVAFIPFAGFIAFVMDGVFIGITRTRALLLSMAVAMVTFFLTYHAFEARMANDALWLAFETYLLVRGIVLLIIWRRLRRTR